MIIIIAKVKKIKKMRNNHQIRKRKHKYTD